MQTSVSRSLRKQALAACAVAALAAPAAASAAPVVADLHVEAGGKALADSSYLTDTTSIRTDTQPARVRRQRADQAPPGRHRAPAC